MVTVSLEVYEALKRLEDSNYSKLEIVYLAYINSFTGRTKVLNSKELDLQILIKCLMQGCKLENEYMKDTLPSDFKFKVDGSETTYHATKSRGLIMVMWKIDNKIEGLNYKVPDVLHRVNSGKWKIIDN